MRSGTATKQAASLPSQGGPFRCSWVPSRRGGAGYSIQPEARDHHARRCISPTDRLRAVRASTRLASANRGRDPLRPRTIRPLPPAGDEAGTLRQRTSQPAVGVFRRTGLSRPGSRAELLSRTARALSRPPLRSNRRSGICMRAGGIECIRFTVGAIRLRDTDRVFIPRTDTSAELRRYRPRPPGCGARVTPIRPKPLKPVSGAASALTSVYAHYNTNLTKWPHFLLPMRP